MIHFASTIKKIKINFLGHQFTEENSPPPLGGSVAAFLFSFFQQLRHCGQNSASQKLFHGTKYTEPSIVASVLNISDWLYGRNVRDPIFSTPSALHHPLIFHSFLPLVPLETEPHNQHKKLRGKTVGQNPKIPAVFTMSGLHPGFLVICKSKTTSCKPCLLWMQTCCLLQFL